MLLLLLSLGSNVPASCPSFLRVPGALLLGTERRRVSGEDQGWLKGMGMGSFSREGDGKLYQSIDEVFSTKRLGETDRRLRARGLCMHREPWGDEKEQDSIL